MAVLTCEKCGYENEPERIYCHNCGAKLDRSALKDVLEKEKRTKSTRQAAAKAQQALRNFLSGGVRGFFSVIAASFLVAALVQVVRIPDGTPALSQQQLDNAPDIVFHLENAITSPRAGQLSYTENQVNAFLQNTIRGQAREVPLLNVEFKRVFVVFDEGICKIYLEQSILGAPFYAGAAFKIDFEDDQMVVRDEAVYLGRLTLPGAVRPVFGFMLDSIWHALRRETSLVKQLAGIQFQESEVSMITSGSN